MAHQLVHFFERAGVEQQLDALARRELAFLVLAFTAFGPAAFLRVPMSPAKFL
jgi:hypothetical protein